MAPRGKKQTRCAKWHCILKYLIKYGNISEIFHEIFQHQKHCILYITTHYTTQLQHCVTHGKLLHGTPIPFDIALSSKQLSYGFDVTHTRICCYGLFPKHNMYYMYKALYSPNAKI